MTNIDLLASQLYGTAGFRQRIWMPPIIYDPLGPTILPALEASGFCDRGEAKDFVNDGNIEVGGPLPINTHGGQVGEAYIHGMHGIAEAVCQVRDNAINQVMDLNNILVISEGGVPIRDIILGS